MRFRVPLALLVVVIAILGALLHPLAMALAIAPFDTSRLVAFLVELRSVIADLLGWGLLGLLVVMVFFIVRGRFGLRARELTGPSMALGQGSGSVVVAITGYNDAEATTQAVKDFLRQPFFRHSSK